MNTNLLSMSWGQLAWKAAKDVVMFVAAVVCLVVFGMALCLYFVQL